MFKLGTPTLVVRKFDIDENGADGAYLEIEGRASGFISWLLTVMKLDTLTTLRLSDDNLAVKTSSLSGEIHTVMPLAAIESTQCGFSKSILWLVLGAFLVISGLMSGDSSALFGMLLIGAVFFVLYFLSRRMFIAVTAGNTTVNIAFKKGMIEGVPVNLDRTLSAIQMLNNLVIKQHTN